ncbi:MAG TPA: hypothetical protein VGN00_14230 [Puia sp.]|jgi:hypothetical protein
MPERYNFVTDNLGDRAKAIEAIAELNEFANNVMLHEFERYDRKPGYFITGQSIEVDSNAGCYELIAMCQAHELAAVFINGPSEMGIIKSSV